MADQSYNDVLRNRLAAIQQQGQQATQYAKLQEDQRRASSMAADQEGYNNSIRQSLATPVSLGQNNPGGKGGTDFNSFVNSIMRQESGGNSNAVNRSSGALGLYQVMPNNVRSWSQEALGHSVSNQKFLASPEIQNKVARYKLQQYYQMYGPAGAAVAWYAGPGAAQKYAKSGRASSKSQGAYPTVSNYVQQVLTRLGIY
jgi:soluble lytic murein transglycosylase-like protein